jgi:hypothetical protein
MHSACQYNHPLLSECPQTLYHKVCTSFFSLCHSFWIDGSYVFLSSGLNLFTSLLPPAQSCILPLQSFQFPFAHSLAPFFHNFFLGCDTLVCSLCHFLVMDHQYLTLGTTLNILYHRVLIPLFHLGLSSSPCENSPSPTFRECLRAACGQSTSSFQGSYNGQPHGIYHIFSALPSHCCTNCPWSELPRNFPLYHSTSQDVSKEPPPKL